MANPETKLTLWGSVALGTGVMIGAGIFALVGQVAGLSGGWFPVAFVFGALVAWLSSHSYARYSAVNPSAGGVAMLLKAAYGPGVIAGSFSLFMYVSMVVAESLLARTFGTYLLRPFHLETNGLVVAVLGVVAVAAAAAANLVGNRLVEESAQVTAAIKIVGIAVLAIAGLIGAMLSGSAFLSSASGPPVDPLSAVAGVALCVLAYKGFTTITNQGGDLRDPKRNIPRSIAISIGICTVLYVLITLSVDASIGAAGAVKARDYALAQAAEPLFGDAGVYLTVAIAVVATLSGLLASIYSVSRLYSMLQSMHLAPSLPSSVTHQPLLITAGLAITLTALFDLSRISALGVFFYLSMDVAIQWGVLRHLREQTRVQVWRPVATLVIDATLLTTFAIVKVQTDLLTVSVVVVIAVAIFAGQAIATRRRAA